MAEKEKRGLGVHVGKPDNHRPGFRVHFGDLPRRILDILCRNYGSVQFNHKWLGLRRKRKRKGTLGTIVLILVIC